MRISLPRLSSLLGLIFFSMYCNVAFSEIKVAVTIKPLHSLVASITDGVLSPDLLVRGNSSPHQTSLRPSDIVKIDNADLIVTVHPNLSGSLSTAINNVKHKKVVITLSDIPGIHSLPARSIREKHSEHSHQHHSTGSVDPHFWLDIENINIFVYAVTQSLTELDSKNSSIYTANRDRLLKRLYQLDNQIKTKMDIVRQENVKILLFHDAYQYFENRYQLHIDNFISASPEHRPGTKHLSNLQQKIVTGEITCVLSEPQFNSRIFDQMLTKKQIKRGSIDPIGSQLEPGKEAYFQLMEMIAESFYSCLH